MPFWECIVKLFEAKRIMELEETDADKRIIRTTKNTAHR